MTRTEAMAAYAEARERCDTRAMHHAEKALREATHRVLGKPRWRRWLDRWLA